MKVFRVTRNLNKSNAKMIMANITPHIDMRAKVVCSFKSEIHRGDGEIVDRGFTTRCVYKEENSSIS